MKNMSGGDPASYRRRPVRRVFFMGIVAFHSPARDTQPGHRLPLVLVQVAQPGAAPQEIETQIVQKVEGAVAGIATFNITSVALESQGRIFIEFQIGNPSTAPCPTCAMRSQGPGRSAEGIQEPVVQRVDVDGGAIAYYASAPPACPSRRCPGSSTTRLQRLLSVRELLRSRAAV